MHLVLVGDVEEAFFQEASCSVRDHAVTFHLTKPQPTISPPPLSRLPGQNLRRSSPPRVHLVLNHVLQPLIIRGTQKDHHLHLLARKAIIHDFITPQLIAQLMQFGRDPVHGADFSPLAVYLRCLERCSVALVARKRSDF